MKRLQRLLAVSFFALAAIPAAQASPLYYGAFLSGPGESPPNASPGSGTALLIYQPLAHKMTIEVSFTHLIGLTTASHIHCCTAAPSNGTAGVATQLPSFSMMPLGVSTGTFHQTFDMLLDSTYNPAFEAANGGTAAGAEAALLAGINNREAYLNIHTSAFPSGEIRGFIGPVSIHFTPEPATLALLGVGVLGAFGVRRKKAQSLLRNMTT